MVVTILLAIAAQNRCRAVVRLAELPTGAGYARRKKPRMAARRRLFPSRDSHPRWLSLLEKRSCTEWCSDLKNVLAEFECRRQTLCCMAVTL